MRSVGEIYDKLTGFLASVAQQQNTQEPAQAPPQGDQNA
jgi:hypothetical protein